LPVQRFLFNLIIDKCENYLYYPMMRLSIFSRLIIVYLAVFVPVTGVNIYNIIQLRQFTNETYHILDIDNRITDYEKKLTDSILSQARYERKYIIIKDDALYDQFLFAERDFSQYFDEVMSVADTPNKRDLLMEIKDYHNRYLSRFSEEIEFVRANKRYPQNWYKQEKEKVLNGIMEGLKSLKVYTEQDTYRKIKKLGEDGANAQRLAIVMTIISLLFGIIISIFITRSITKPLTVMKKKTRDIAGGDFEGYLNLSSPPEIEDLAQAFNLMSNKLKEIDKMKSDFFSLMAHELRTPLASIKEGTNLMLEGIGGEVTDKQKRLLTITSEQSNRLIDLVNSLLDLSKIEAGMIALNLTNSDIKSLINKAVAETEPLAVAKNVTLKVDIAQDLPIIKMDNERILQVLLNLIGNAVKFTTSGGKVTVSAQTVGQEVRVSVIDTGPGIPKENLNTVFDKFKQATITSYNTTKGTGLGLAIVKYIIIAHGGSVWVESEVGHGSTFIFALPV